MFLDYINTNNVFTYIFDGYAISDKKNEQNVKNVESGFFVNILFQIDQNIYLSL